MNPKHIHRFAPVLKSGCLLLALALLAGCPKDREQSRIKDFEHQKHAEYTPECSMCHDTATPGALPAAGHDTCLVCHEFELAAPDERCLLCHALPEKAAQRRLQTGGENEYQLLNKYLAAVSATRAEERGQLRGDVIFDHSRHEKLNCADCHGDVLSEQSRPPLAMGNCMDCHAQLGAPNECATCHSVIREDVKPQSHTAAWTRAHGMESRINAQNCTYCHEQSSCDDCHFTEQPQNHNAFFRKRGHGFFAENDRSNCAVCHQTDFCESCHFEVEPQSHTAHFKRNAHCASCHFPVREGTKCAVCHQDFSHNLAAPIPHPIASIRQCQPCHRPGNIPHATNTIHSNQCALCHRPAGGGATFIEHPLDLTLNCNLCHAPSILPHSIAGLTERDCQTCHTTGPTTPFSQDSPSPPHSLVGVPFSKCASCHTFNREALERFQRGRR